MKVISLLSTLALAFPIQPIDQIDAEFANLTAYLNQLPAEQYTELIDTLSGHLKAEIGMSFDDLEKLSSDELDEFILTLSTGPE